ncbi:MAG TPA: hypothetical protein P5514_11570 [Bacteroidales bacterium]|nr:hypothetical protein [Bacteroidales bacterium]HRX97577.1 hypothetical protein [Bacteroidales bacterium]
MKKIFLIITIGFCFSLLKAQDNQSGILQEGEKRVGVATGIDYSILPLELSYQRGYQIFNYKHPVALGTEISIPMFNPDFSDIRIRLTSETSFIQKNKFVIRGGIDPVFVNVKMETERMSSVGADLHVFTGFVNPKWMLGLDLNYNQIFQLTLSIPKSIVKMYSRMQWMVGTN